MYFESFELTILLVLSTFLNKNLLKIMQLISNLSYNKNMFIGWT